MNTVLSLRAPTSIDDERRAALLRLDDDLRTVARAAHPSASAPLELLRRRIVALYRVALSSAAGVPDDRIWTLLAVAVAIFTSSVAEQGAPGAARSAAYRRLRALALEAPAN